MTSDESEAGSASPGQPPPARDDEPPEPSWPAELVPPAEAPEPSSAAPSAGTNPPREAGPAPQNPPVPQGPPTWGRPPDAAGPGSTAPSSGGWGIATPPPPAGPAPAWGAPPAQPAEGQPPAWGAPPPQGGGWSPGPQAPGGPPGAWAPASARSDNGCLKGCLIVGVIVVVVGILGVVALGFIAGRFVEDAGINVDGSFDQCQLISAADVESVLGPDAAALPLGGIVDVTIGQVLDKRLLPDAPDCWLISDSSSSITGRLAREDGNGSSVFQAARQEAEDGGFFASDEAFGDQAFCTAMTEFGGFGALVRRGDRVAYVSLLDADAMQRQDFEMNADGQLVSPATCQLAGQLAEAALR